MHEKGQKFKASFLNVRTALTLHVDVDELGEHERHAPWWRPRHLVVHDGDDGFAQQVRQRQLPVTVVRCHVLGADTCHHHLQEANRGG